MVRLRTVPGGNYTVRLANGAPQAEQADEEGMAETALVPGKPVTVQVYGAVAPPAQTITASDYVSLADYYVQRREIDRAFSELARLTATYPGSEVAKLADQRADALRKRCGALIVVNRTAQPVMASYAGNQLSSGVVEPGRDRRFLLWAGSYHEEIRDIYGNLEAGDDKGAVTVSAGQAAIRDYTGPADDTGVKLLRGPLAADEELALVTAAQQQLGMVQAVAEGGGTPAAGAGSQSTETTPAPTLSPIKVDFDLVKTMPVWPAGVSRFTVRNRTSRKAVLNIRHRALPPNPTKLIEVPIDPRRTAQGEADLEGTYEVWIHFPDSGQDLNIGEHKADGSVFTITVGEFTSRQMERRKADKAKGVSEGKAVRERSSSSTESSIFGAKSSFGSGE